LASPIPSSALPSALASALSPVKEDRSTAVVFPTLSYGSELRLEPPFTFALGPDCGSDLNRALLREAEVIANQAVTVNNGLKSRCDALVASFQDPFDDMPSTALEALPLLSGVCRGLGVKVSSNMMESMVPVGLERLPQERQAQVLAADALRSFVQSSKSPSVLAKLFNLTERMQNPLPAGVTESVARALAFLQALVSRFDDIRRSAAASPVAASPASALSAVSSTPVLAPTPSPAPSIVPTKPPPAPVAETIPAAEGGGGGGGGPRRGSLWEQKQREAAEAAEAEGGLEVPVLQRRESLWERDQRLAEEARRREEELSRLVEGEHQQQETESAAPAPAANSGGVTRSYPLEQLVQGQVYPADVDPDARELSLSDTDFRALLGMEKPAFNKLPAWRRKSIKAKHGLF
jgi:hypothetical protein